MRRNVNRNVYNAGKIQALQQRLHLRNFRSIGADDRSFGGVREETKRSLATDRRALERVPQAVGKRQRREDVRLRRVLRHHAATWGVLRLPSRRAHRAVHGRRDIRVLGAVREW